jgi:protein TIF31
LNKKVRFFILINNIVNDLKQIGDFIRNDAISSLIVESLAVAEGGPTDSDTLKSLFHKHGVNMRYLGRVLDIFRRYCQEKGLKFKHIEFILEKEIFVRALRHVFIKYISKCPIELATA